MEGFGALEAGLNLEKNEYYGGEKGKLKRKLKERGVRCRFMYFGRGRYVLEIKASLIKI